MDRQTAEEILVRLSNIENILIRGFAMLYSGIRAIYCHQKGDAVAANSYAVNMQEELEKIESEEVISGSSNDNARLF